MSTRFHRLSSLTARAPFVAACALGFAASFAALAPRGAAQAVASSPDGVQSFSTRPGLRTVHTKFGGFILGYDIDQAGDTGILAESLALPDGKQTVAVETFDQGSGKILKVVVSEHDSKNDYAALGVVGNAVGLVEFEHVTNLFVDQRLYFTLNPLSTGPFVNNWLPPLGLNDIIDTVTQSQGVPEAAVLAFHNGGNNDTLVFSTDVAADTFGPLITVTDPHFAANHVPVMALDSANHQAVLGALGDNPFGPPVLAKVDLVGGSVHTFTGVGTGYVNGIAVDSATGLAATTTEIDFRVEFYNLATEVGVPVVLPGAVSQAQSGADVQVDTIHKLFLVGQPISSVSDSGSAIHVFDEQGHFVEVIKGLQLPASPVLIAIQPMKRVGWVLKAPDLTELQSFAY